MESTPLKFDDVLEHRADCHFFLDPGTTTQERGLKDNEDMAVRFARTFGTERQWRETQRMITNFRIKRSQK